MDFRFDPGLDRLRDALHDVQFFSSRLLTDCAKLKCLNHNWPVAEVFPNRRRWAWQQQTTLEGTAPPTDEERNYLLSSLVDWWDAWESAQTALDALSEAVLLELDSIRGAGWKLRCRRTLDAIAKWPLWTKPRNHSGLRLATDPASLIAALRQSGPPDWSENLKEIESCKDDLYALRRASPQILPSGSVPWEDAVPNDTDVRVEWPWRIRVLRLDHLAQLFRVTWPIERVHLLMKHLAFGLCYARHDSSKHAMAVMRPGDGWREGEQEFIRWLCRINEEDLHAVSDNLFVCPPPVLGLRIIGPFDDENEFWKCLNHSLVHFLSLSPWSVPAGEWSASQHDFWGLVGLPGQLALHLPQGSRSDAHKSVTAWRAAILFGELRALSQSNRPFIQAAWQYTHEPDPVYRLVNNPSKEACDEASHWLTGVLIDRGRVKERRRTSTGAHSHCETAGRSRPIVDSLSKPSMVEQALPSHEKAESNTAAHLAALRRLHDGLVQFLDSGWQSLGSSDDTPDAGMDPDDLDCDSVEPRGAIHSAVCNLQGFYGNKLPAPEARNAWRELLRSCCEEEDAFKRQNNAHEFAARLQNWVDWEIERVSSLVKADARPPNNPLMASKDVAETCRQFSDLLNSLAVHIEFRGLSDEVRNQIAGWLDEGPGDFALIIQSARHYATDGAIPDVLKPEFLAEFRKRLADALDGLRDISRGDYGRSAGQLAGPASLLRFFARTIPQELADMRRPELPPGWQGDAPPSSIHCIDDLLAYAQSSLESARSWADIVHHEQPDKHELDVARRCRTVINNIRAWIFWKSVSTLPEWFANPPVDATRELEAWICWLRQVNHQAAVAAEKSMASDPMTASASATSDRSPLIKDADLEGYFSEISGVEDEWLKEEVERWQSGRGGRHIGSSPWTSNREKLDEIGRRFAVSPDDPRVYSIAAYKFERKRLNAEWLEECRRNGWPNKVASGTPEFQVFWTAQYRWEARVADLDARHFSGLGEAGEAVNRRYLWAFIQKQAIPFLRTISASPHLFLPQKDDSGKNDVVVSRVFSALHELQVPWADKPPYAPLGLQESIDKLVSIANQLEADEIAQVREATTGCVPASSGDKPVIWRRYPFKNYEMSKVFRPGTPLWVIQAESRPILLPSYQASQADCDLLQHAIRGVDPWKPNWAVVKGALAAKGWIVNEETEIQEVLGFLKALPPSHRAGNLGTQNVAPAVIGNLDGPPTDAQKTGEKNGPRKKRSTVKGEAQDKIIAALALHHKYSNGSCLHTEAIGVRALARRAGVGEATASDFFRDKFAGWQKYRAKCQSPSLLAASLKMLQGEYVPKDFDGYSLPDELSTHDVE